MASRERSAAISSEIVKNQIAVRCSRGQERKVREMLASLGTLEEQPAVNILILHCGRDVQESKVTAAIETLQAAGRIEFATPVLRDRESGLRQLLTDEITLRLKRGRGKRVLSALQAAYGIIVGKHNEFEPTQYIVKVPNASGTQTLDVARALDKRDDVDFASPNYITGIKR